MVKRLFALGIVGLALVFGQRLEVGGWLGSPPASLGPTLHLAYPSGDWRFDVYMRALWPRTDETNVGLSLVRAFEAGPAGRAEVGFRGHLGLDTQYWVEGQARFAMARTAVSMRLGYTENRTPSHFWPFERETLGLYADLDLKFRAEKRLFLLGAYRFEDEASGLELALAWLEARRTYTLGAGAVREPTNAYALLGLRTPIEGAIVDAAVRIGARNEFALRYAEPRFKGRLLLAYPARARVGVSWSGWSFDAGVDRAGFELFLRYRFEL